MTKFILGLGLLLGACSGSDGGSAPTLDGQWQLALANGCYATYSFSGGTWSDNVICQLTSGNYGMEVESGSLNKTPDTLDYMPQRSSCPGHAISTSSGYSFQSGELVLRFSDATLILKKASAGPVPDGALIANGCWDFSQSPARFTPGAIEQL